MLAMHQADGARRFCQGCGPNHSSATFLVPTSMPGYRDVGRPASGRARRVAPETASAHASTGRWRAAPRTGPRERGNVRSKSGVSIPVPDRGAVALALARRTGGGSRTVRPS